MVAKIVIGKSIGGIIHYNERKVASGDAQIILASGFGCEMDRLSIQNKIQRFRYLIELKPTVKTNALHITLNFDASEKINNEKMQLIAMDYMERIGFGDQPFLVYRHNDVAHQHVHIATVSINSDGKAIQLHNIGREKSEPARKAIEKEFDLIVAESRRFKPDAAIKPADAEKVKYGHLPTKRAMSNVVSAVMNTYAFTSIAEYNAILRQFNVIAEKGLEGTDMFRNKGMIYSLLNKDGEKIGVPIKASAFHCKPTFRNLERCFAKNEDRRTQFKPDLKHRIEKVFARYETITRETLIAELRKSGINLIFRVNEQGVTYGATFVDNQRKTVFNGSDLGKSFSASDLLNRLRDKDTLKTYLKPLSKQEIYLQPADSGKSTSYLNLSPPTNYLDTLFAKAQTDPNSIVPKGKKKRRRGFKL